MRNKNVEDRVARKYKVPREDRVIAVFDAFPDTGTSKGGIILPFSAQISKNKHMVGTAVSVGKNIVGIKKGDRILVERIQGSPMYEEELEGCLLRLLDQGQVTAILDDEIDVDTFWEKGATF